MPSKSPSEQSCFKLRSSHTHLSGHITPEQPKVTKVNKRPRWAIKADQGFILGHQKWQKYIISSPDDQACSMLSSSHIFVTVVVAPKVAGIFCLSEYQQTHIRNICKNKRNINDVAATTTNIQQKKGIQYTIFKTSFLKYCYKTFQLFTIWGLDHFCVQR